jgi:hypothetical protein
MRIKVPLTSEKCAMKIDLMLYVVKPVDELEKLTKD